MRYGGTVAQMEDDFFEVRRIGGLSQSFSHKWENVNPDRDALLVCPSLFSSLFSDFQCYSKMLRMSFAYMGFGGKEILFHSAMWIVKLTRRVFFT